MTTESKFSLSEIFELLGRSLILLQDKHITVVESDHETDAEVKERVSLVDYIVRAVGDELLERHGETEESIQTALDKTQMEFSSIAYPKESKGVSIYNDIH